MKRAPRGAKRWGREIVGGGRRNRGSSRRVLEERLSLAEHCVGGKVQFWVYPFLISLVTMPSLQTST
eukprot:3207135-Amphidinium_carterae.1